MANPIPMWMNGAWLGYYTTLIMRCFPRLISIHLREPTFCADAAILIGLLRRSWDTLPTLAFRVVPIWQRRCSRLTNYVVSWWPARWSGLHAVWMIWRFLRSRKS